MSCCVLSAPHQQKQHGKSAEHNPHDTSGDLKDMTADLLKDKLEFIIEKAELELKEMEIKAQLFQAIRDDPEGKSLTPEQLLLLRQFQANQNDEDSGAGGSSTGGLISSLFDRLSELAKTKVLLEDNELFLYSLLKNRQPREGQLSLTELALIYRYHESMSQSLRRSRFLLMLHLTNMDLDFNDMTPEQQKVLVASLMRRMEQERDETWEKEEALLLNRYRQGKATLAGTLMAYRRLDAMMNSGLGSHLRNLVKNELRMKLMNGSGMGTMNGWMNNEQWMNASDAEHMNEMWELYKLRHNRNHKDKNVERMRRRNFEKKVSEVMQHNIEAQLKRQLYTLALNNFSDWTQEELAKLRGYKSVTTLTADYEYAEGDLEAQAKDVEEGERARVSLPDMPTYTNTVPTSQLPSYVNWSNTSWVGPIQNQHQCGSCWTFSASGALEAQYYNKTKTFVTMSEQNLVDCTYYLGNLGCEGGNVELAFYYVMSVGIDTYASYPYTGWANNGTCLYNPANSVTQNNGWRFIPEGNELALQQAVALVGPVSVSIDASLSSFDSYSGGVYAPANCSTTELDHAVLVVGYGTTTDGQDYWLIKNSWGTDWGINGYMMMERGVNMCGVATAAIFPVID